MWDIKKFGCKFVLDDFGVGFFLLYYIKQLLIDMVKIDGFFICYLLEEFEDQVLVCVVVEVFRVFGLVIVVEFVENESILEVFMLLGVDYVQGYYIFKLELFDVIWLD